MTAPGRPSLDDIVASVDQRPSLDDIVASVDVAPAGPVVGGKRKPRGYKTPEQIKRLNKADVAEADASGPDLMQRVEAMQNRAATAIPGGEAVMSGLRNVANRMRGTPESFQESVQGVKQSAEEGGQNAPGVNVPLLGRVALPEVLAGGMGYRTAARALTKMSAPALGALYNAATRVLNPEDESLGSRAVGTAGAAAVGAALPKITETVLDIPANLRTWAKSKSAPSYNANMLERTAERSSYASPAYDAFRALPPLPETPSLAKHLDVGAIRTAINAVRNSSVDLKNVPDTDPRLLDAVYKKIGNRAWQMENGYDLGKTVQSFGEAIDEAAQQRGGSYAEPLRRFRESSEEIDALRTGRKAQDNAVRGKTPERKIATESPEAFKTQMAGEDVRPEVRQAAAEGVLSGFKGSPLTARFLKVIPYGPSKELAAATDLLRAAEGRGPGAFQQALNSLRGQYGDKIMDILSDRNWTGAKYPMPGSIAHPEPTGTTQAQVRAVLGNPTKLLPSGSPMSSVEYTTQHAPGIPVWQTPENLPRTPKLLPSGLPPKQQLDVKWMKNTPTPFDKMEGPPRPASGELSPAEQLRRAKLWAWEQQAKRGERFNPEAEAELRAERQAVAEADRPLPKNPAKWRPDELDSEIQRLHEELANEEQLIAHEGTPEWTAHENDMWRKLDSNPYNTKKVSKKEDLPDAGGEVDSDKLDAMRKMSAEYKKRTLMRRNKEARLKKLQDIRDKMGPQPGDDVPFE